jgi:hypothetical protein
MTPDQLTLLKRVATGDILSYREIQELALSALKDQDALEQLRVQLAGCSVAATGWSKGENAAKPGDYGYSASYGDVTRLRQRYELVQKQLDAAWLLIDTLKPPQPETVGGDNKFTYPAFKKYPYFLPRSICLVCGGEHSLGMMCPQLEVYCRAWGMG